MHGLDKQGVYQNVEIYDRLFTCPFVCCLKEKVLSVQTLEGKNIEKEVIPLMLTYAKFEFVKLVICVLSYMYY